MSQSLPPVPAKWTEDCQGKQDYDGQLVCLSTRYWPRGGGVTVYNSATGEFTTNRDRTIRPSASAAIYLGSTENDYYDDAVCLVKCRFEEDEPDAVQQAVERWAAEQYARIGRALHREFASDGFVRAAEDTARDNQEDSHGQ